MFPALETNLPPPDSCSPKSHGHLGLHSYPSLSMQDFEDKKLPPLAHAIPAEFRSSNARESQTIFGSPVREAHDYPRQISRHSTFAEPSKYERRPSYPSMISEPASSGQDARHTKFNAFGASAPEPYSSSRNLPGPQLKPPASGHGVPSCAPGLPERQWESPPAEGPCKWCIAVRPVVQEIISGLLILEMEINGAGQTGMATVSTPRAPEVARDGAMKALHWTLETIHRNIRRWKEGHEKRTSYSADSMLLTSVPPAPPKRKFSTSELEEGDSVKFKRSIASYDFPHISDDTHKAPYATEHSHGPYSPHRTASSSGSAIMPPISPRQSGARMLPSPSSTNFSSAQIATQVSVASSSMQISAQTAHLQELQHQVSIKTLALQTLQQEYDSLIQKLERQRTKCATLEKKFEVSDAEINSLTDERERLQAQVAMLEEQAEKLQQSRDEARTQSVANGGQYMKIMEMASRLQAQGAADKRKWDAEKQELEAKVASLERKAKATDAESNDTSEGLVDTPTELRNDAISGASEPKKADGDEQTETKPLQLTVSLNPGIQPTVETVGSTLAPIACTSRTSDSFAPKTLLDELQALLRESDALEAMGSSLSRKGADMRSLLQKMSSSMTFKAHDDTQRDNFAQVAGGNPTLTNEMSA